MAITNTTKMANRYGLDLEFYDYKADGTVESDPVAKIDFANEVALNLASDITWATGGKVRSRQVGFNNPYEGSVKISTQMVTMQLLALVSNGDPTASDAKATFKNDPIGAKPKFYIIKGKTTWVDTEGNVYAEAITLYKACVKAGYNVAYSGEGDPLSIDVEFDLGANENDLVAEIERMDDTSTATAE